MLEMNELAASLVPTIEASLGSNPQRSVTIECQGKDAVVDQRVRIRRIVAQMLKASRGGVQKVNAGVAGPDPYATVLIQQQGAHGITCKRIGIAWIVPIDLEGVTRAV